MDPAELSSRLAKYPTLFEQMKELLEVVENREGDIRLADEAEERVVLGIRDLGRSLLTEWANRQSKRLASDYTKKVRGLRKHVKKN